MNGLFQDSLTPAIDHAGVAATHRATQGLPALVWVGAALLALVGLASSNPFLTSCAVLILPALMRLSWRHGEPPVLMFACCMQWLQASAAIFYSDCAGLSVNQALGNDASNFASWLSLFAVLALAVGMRVAMIKASPPQQEKLEHQAQAADIPKLAVMYAISFVLSASINAVAFKIPSLTQVLLAFTTIKWLCVFLICYAVLEQNRGYGYLVSLLALEFSVGLLGIFSNFKNVFFVLVVAAMSSPFALRGRRFVVLLMCTGVLLVSGVVWSAIKTDYRSFLSEEAVGPNGTISIERKFAKLSDVGSSFTWENFSEGLEALVLRVSYVEYFALAIEHVPSQLPFEHGALWSGSIKHIVTPRLLFPNKPELDDSERTKLYTGAQVAGQESGSSIGIGYVGESYIDFGPLGMFVPIFILGVFYGLIYRFFVTRARFNFIGSAIATAILVFGAYTIETSNIKLVGGNVVVLLILGSVYLTAAGSVTKALRR